VPDRTESGEPRPPLVQAPGPGRGPNGSPAAIGLTPILSARYHASQLEAIRSAAPGARLVSISAEGLADDRLDDVEVLLRGPIPAAIFERIVGRCPDLRWVHSATAGVERVLVPVALQRGLTITNARGVFSRPIAEYVMLMILAVSRRLPQLLELQRERTWQPLNAVELRDVTVGIVGLGSIGRATAALATAFGCRVLATRRQAGAGISVDPLLDDPAEQPPVQPRVDHVWPPEDLPELLAQSDFVVLALPLTQETRSLMDASMLARMKPGAWLINVARGALVDERALIHALREGPLGGAVLDAFTDEPLQRDSPFYDLPNVIVTPHTSWSSGRVLERSISLFCANLRRYAAGEALQNVVEPGLGY
jgi:phosphoglycerate dehydrogenase-like enzyme